MNLRGCDREKNSFMAGGCDSAPCEKQKKSCSILGIEKEYDGDGCGSDGKFLDNKR